MGEISSVSEELDGVGPVPAGDDNSPSGDLGPPQSLEDDDEVFFDSVTGVALPKEKVLAAREEELS